MKGELEKLQKGISFLEGAAEDIDYMRAIWSGLQT